MEIESVEHPNDNYIGHKLLIFKVISFYTPVLK